MIVTEKSIEPGSFRWIGQRVAALSTLDVPIGARDADAILRHCGGKAYRIGRISPNNAFVIDRDPLRLLYVRPGYTGYRRAAGKVFTAPRRKVDYDHALGRQSALALGFGFVLLIRLTPLANRSHGSFEKAAPLAGPNMDPLCFADRRIVDKWLGRPPHRMNRDPAQLAPFQPGIREQFGLTLKQAGVWGFAMGVEDGPLSPGVLQPL